MVAKMYETQDDQSGKPAEPVKVAEKAAEPVKVPEPVRVAAQTPIEVYPAKNNTEVVAQTQIAKQAIKDQAEKIKAAPKQLNQTEVKTK